MSKTGDKGFARLPRHVGIIPDGNRRWATDRGLSPAEGYAAGIEPAFRLLEQCRELGIEEVSIYGFTKENVRRPSEQVQRFRQACVEVALGAVEAGASLLAVGDTGSPLFPDALRPFARERSPGDILVNYGWQWDLFSALERANRDGAVPYSEVPRALASAGVSRVDLVVRWGGRRRLSGFLPLQCAYADFYVVEGIWPDLERGDFLEALDWYQDQDVTLGG